jgi:PiT family inorganic phosphate transporter
VSFGHGSNDGQKGMGLIMLILIGLLPSVYAVNLVASPTNIEHLADTAQKISDRSQPPIIKLAMADSMGDVKQLSDFLSPKGEPSDGTFAAVAARCDAISRMLKGKSSLIELTPAERRTLRSDLYLTSEALGKLAKTRSISDPGLEAEVTQFRRSADAMTKFIPSWVKVAVALALGIGTTIGWKRIVVTVGEKIGKEHLTYAQGAAAELVAGGTILAADTFGLPVSTTHVLSSGVAGTMAANRSGLQTGTLRNLLLAWVLTLPVTVLLGAGIFAFVLNILLSLGFK